MGPSPVSPPHACLGTMAEDKKKPPFWKLTKSIMPEDASEEELLEAAANLHEFMLVAYRMYLRREFEGKLGELKKGREDIEP